MEYFLQMSSESEWSDWSGINYIDWEELKEQAGEKVRMMLRFQLKQVQRKQTWMFDARWRNWFQRKAVLWHVRVGKWRWRLDYNLRTLKYRLRTERIECILQNESWDDTQDIDIRSVNNLIKEPLFPCSPYRTYSDYILENDNETVASDIEQTGEDYTDTNSENIDMDVQVDEMESNEKNPSV